MTRSLRQLSIVALFLLCGAMQLQAQGRPLRVVGGQPLNFGTLLGGIPTTISPTDPLNSGQLDVRGEKNAEVTLDFLLPSDLMGPGGATVPLTFSPGSAGYSLTGSINAQFAFDPSVPEDVILPKTGKIVVYLGGTASPPPAPPPGSYSATITLTVSYLGS